MIGFFGFYVSTEENARKTKYTLLINKLFCLLGSSEAFHNITLNQFRSGGLVVTVMSNSRKKMKAIINIIGNKGTRKFLAKRTFNIVAQNFFDISFSLSTGQTRQSY